MIDELIMRLKAENIPTFSMSESQLSRANEIIKEISDRDLLQEDDSNEDTGVNRLSLDV